MLVLQSYYKINIHGRQDDDVIDRLNHRFTPIILLTFLFLVSEKQFFGADRIWCWTPAHFSDYHEFYTFEYCWVKGTYYVPFEERLPSEDEVEKYQQVAYYQWVPIILMIQALLFHFPCTVWRSLSPRCGLDLDDFIDKVQVVPCMPESIRRRAMPRFGSILHRLIRSQRQNYKMACTISITQLSRCICMPGCGRYHGNYLFVLYTCTKLLYLFNILIQFLLLNWILAVDYWVYGWEVIDKIADGDSDWSEAGAFPRVTICDFRIRRLGNVQRYAVQCVLPINLLNEKIYIFLYFWMLLLAILTFFSLLRWTLFSSSRRQRYHYIKKKIITGCAAFDKVGRRSQKDAIKDFVDNYLRQDGVFLLRLISDNVDNITTDDLILQVWRQYCRIHQDTMPPEVISLCRLPTKRKISPRKTENNLPTIAEESESLNNHDIERALDE